MPEGLLLVVWSSIGLWVVSWVGLWVHSFYFAMGWVGLKKLDSRTTLVFMALSAKCKDLYSSHAGTVVPECFKDHNASQ